MQDPKRDTARRLRKRPTPAERDVWQLVRDRRLLAFKFRRQHIIRGFIVDFYCAELQLVLEIDGGVHATPAQAAYDAERTAILEGLGLRVLRIPNERCTREDLVDLLGSVAKELTRRPPLPEWERGQG